MANHEKNDKPEVVEGAMGMPLPPIDFPSRVQPSLMNQSYRITDRAADWVDEAMTQIWPDEEVAWEVMVLPQSEQGPCVGIFVAAKAAILGSLAGALNVLPLIGCNREAVFDSVRALKETVAQARSQQLSQANGHGQH